MSSMNLFWYTSMLPYLFKDKPYTTTVLQLFMLSMVCIELIPYTFVTLCGVNASIHMVVLMNFKYAIEGMCVRNNSTKYRVIWRHFYLHIIPLIISYIQLNMYYVNVQKPQKSISPFNIGYYSTGLVIMWGLFRENKFNLSDSYIQYSIYTWCYGWIIQIFTYLYVGSYITTNYELKY